jgi:hypothetical protein
MHVSWTFTGDGLLAFAGGALALFGVWWSNRQSVKNLQKQLGAERDARGSESSERKLAVLRSILFEMDCFYRVFLSNATKFLDDMDVQTTGSFRPIWLTSPEFAILRGNAAYLGTLDDLDLNAVLLCYSTALVFSSLLARYDSALAALPEGELPVTDRRLRGVRSMLGDLKQQREILLVLLYKTEQLLCQKTSTPFDVPGIWVSSERDLVVNLERRLGSSEPANDGRPELQGTEG